MSVLYAVQPPQEAQRGSGGQELERWSLYASRLNFTMTVHTDEMSATKLPCHRCGYDLRAHPPDGKCPECGALVAESRRVALIARRPAWRESDARWRRRVLAGAWLLVFLPLMDVLKAFEW